MKKILIIILTFITISISAQSVYYVQPVAGNANASDSNAGTNINYPWATWEKALLEAKAGDTVYFRGGTVYYPADRIEASVADGTCNMGTPGNPIVFAGYPPDVANGDSIIFDFSNVMPTEPDYEAVEAGESGEYNYGISLSWMNYFEFRDFTVRNVWQKYRYVQARGINFYGCNYFTLERIIVHHIGGQGIFSSNGTLESGYIISESEFVPGDTSYIINCDAYNCIDSLAINPYQYANNQAGSWAQGFFMLINFAGEYMEFNGCRTWNCADDGMNNHGAGTTVLNQCWSFNNGVYLPYLDYTTGGNGFKINNTDDTTQLLINPDMISHWVVRCIASYNNGIGFNENHVAGQPSLNRNNYNNLAYFNEQGFVVTQPDLEGWEHRDNRYINNLGYANTYADYGEYQTAYFETDITNSWSDPPGIIVTDSDFLDLPVNSAENLAILSASRQADGSLPDIGNYFKLSPESSLIDAGTDVGLSYFGLAPDIGVFEYGDEIDSTATNIITFTLADQTGAATINATNHTVTIEVSYTANVASLTPTLTLSEGATVIPASGTARDFTNPVPYTVTAEDGVTYQEWTVTVTQEAEPVTPVPTGGAIVKFNGKIVKR
jgi:hypothetical protein